MHPSDQAPPAEQSRPGESQQASTALRIKKISEAAFYLAEKRGFEPGYHLDDWLTAEAQIDAAQ